MFKQKQTKKTGVGTLIGPATRINGDLEFTGGLHVDGCINGNVTGDANLSTFLSVSQQGAIEGSVIAPNVMLDGTVKGDIDAAERIELGTNACVWGNVYYTIIETAVGAQIKGKLIHRAGKAADGRDPAGKGEPPP